MRVQCFAPLPASFGKGVKLTTGSKMPRTPHWFPVNASGKFQLAVGVAPGKFACDRTNAKPEEPKACDHWAVFRTIHAIA
jgi:hypothetical protein